MAVEDLADPRPPDHSVLVRPEAAGICGSEIEGYLGRMSNRRPPLVMGHEFAGTVAAAGRGVADQWVGRRVAVNPIVSCRTCRSCRAGNTNLCARRTLLGIQHPGGFAGLVVVPEPNLVPMPDGMDPRLGALVEPLANGVHAIRLAHRAGMEQALVIGTGTIGLMAMQAALRSGIPSVAVIEPHAPRRERAGALGAHATYESVIEAREAMRHQGEGLGADLVVDAVGAQATRHQALELLRPGGVAVYLGLHDDATTLHFHQVIRNQVAIQGSFAYSEGDFRDALDWLSGGRAGIGELAPVLPLERGPDLFAELARGPLLQVKVFVAATV